jgi:hypothetical protein
MNTQSKTQAKTQAKSQATGYAQGVQHIKNWDEKPYKEFEGGKKLTKATVTATFTGDIEGDGLIEYLMSYANEKSASYVGLQLVTGVIAGKKGSFVLQLSGAYAGGIASGTWSVVPGSGTGDLHNLAGEGSFSAPEGSEARYTLDYRFE